MSDRSAFVALLNRGAARIAAERRRMAQEASQSLRDAAGDQARYDARIHILTMRAVDAGLNRIYGRYPGDPNALLLQMITQENRATWRERFERIGALDERTEERATRGS